MTGNDVEHRTEIRQENHTTRIWVGLVALGAIIALVVGLGDADGDAAPDAGPTTVPATPTSETLTTTSPRQQPPVYGITTDPRGLLPFSTAVAPASDAPTAEARTTEVADGPIVTGDRVVVLTPDQAIQVGSPGAAFDFAACCWDEIHPSNEPGHVWARSADRAVLIDLELVDATRRVVLDVGGGEILGPASFGVVTSDDRNVVRWHRPSFDPTVVRLPGDRRPLDSGGERLLVAAPASEDLPDRLEVWSITGNGVLSTHDLGDGASAEGRLAPDGSVVLVPASGGWEVRDVGSGLLRGRLPKVADPVWVGGGRFAGALDERLVVSDSGELPLRWPVLAVAEQSP